MPQSFNGTEDASLSGQLVANDPGDSQTFAIATNPTGGQIAQWSAAGNFTYAPRPNLNGTDSFTVTVTDSRNQSATGTVTLNIAPVNDAPQAADDVLSVASVNAIDVLANDTDVDGDTLTVEFLGTPFPAMPSFQGGMVSMPVAAGFKGVVRFDYRVRDPAGAASDATAIAYVGIQPFKTVFIGTPLGGGDEGIYVNDLELGTRPVHPVIPAAEGRVADLSVAAGGGALVYRADYLAAGASPPRIELWYVDLDTPGTAVAVSGPIDAAAVVANIQLSSDGRYASYEVRTPNQIALFSYDASSPATLAQRIGDPAVQPYAFNARFNAANTRIYYSGRVAVAGPGATFRAELATRAVTRVSPEVSGGDGPGNDSVWVAQDESFIVTHRVGRLPFNVGENYIADPSNLNSEVLLHLPTPSAISMGVPLVSPDGEFVLMFARSPFNNSPGPVWLGRTDAPGLEVPVGPGQYALGVKIPDSDRERAGLMRADSRAILLLADCGDGTISRPCNIHEVPFNDPVNPVVVSSPAGADDVLRTIRYSSDGERIVFLRQNSVTGAHGVEAAHRGAFGQRIDVSPPSFVVPFYDVDPSGRVAAMPLGLAGEFQLALINVDAPQTTLILGRSTGVEGTVHVVPR